MEFEINGQTYRAAKLDAFKQFHIARRLAPILSGLAAAGQDNRKDLAEMLEPIASALAAMSDAECDYVLQTCLAAVVRQQGTTWSPIWSTSGKVLVFDDIDLGAMMQIAVRVVQDSLGSFFQGAAEKLNTAATLPQG